MKPTVIRYLVIASASLMSVLLYLDRFCISTAEVFIQQDLDLSDAQIGWMLSAFFWTYALGQVPSGWLTDRFGSRIMLTIYILSWSLFTGLTGVAGVFAGLFALRLGFGAAQAGAYPTAASIVSKWAPFQVRGMASGVIAVGGRVGGVLALFATPYLLVWLTPASTPNELQVADLLDPPKLCFELSANPTPETPSSRLRKRCLQTFDTSVRETVAKHANLYEEALNKERARLEKAGKSPKNAVAKTDLLPAEDAMAIAAQLNSIMKQKGFFTSAEVVGVPLEKEAARLLQRADELDSQQSMRANRLALEGLHRKTIRRLYVAGWRPMMFTYGSLGILVAALFWWSARNTPTEHPLANEAEVELIEAGRPMKASGAGKVGAAPMIPLLTSVSMWLCCASQWFTNIGWLFLGDLGPALLHQRPRLLRGRPLDGVDPAICRLGGYGLRGIRDRQVGSLAGTAVGQMLPMSLSRFVAMGAYLSCLTSPSPVFALAMFSIVAFATDFGTTSVWAFNQDVGGRHVGSVLGWGNMWGNLGAAITPPLLIWIVGEAERWDLAFLTCAVAFLLSGLAAAGVNATIPIAPIENDK